MLAIFYSQSAFCCNGGGQSIFTLLVILVLVLLSSLHIAYITIVKMKNKTLSKAQRIGFYFSLSVLIINIGYFGYNSQKLLSDIFSRCDEQLIEF